MNETYAEPALLHCLLHENACVMNISVLPEHFVNSVYREIYRTFREMIGRNEVVDVVSLAEAMKEKTGRDWIDTITDLAMEVSASVGNVKAYDAIIKKSFCEREVFRIGQSLQEDRSQESRSNAIRELMLLDREAVEYEYTLNQVLRTTIKKLDEDFNIRNDCIKEGKPVPLKGISTGIGFADGYTGGWQAGHLIIIAARPAMGKTAVMLNMMFAAGEKVGCISGEQGVVEIIQRVLSMQSRVDSRAIQTADLKEEDFPKLEVGARKIYGHKGIFLSDKPAPTIEYVEAIARRWKFEYNIKGLFIDYLQKIQISGFKNKFERIGEVAARLKALARELDIPIICLAQVGRQVEARPNKRPRMGDISDSSEIEKEADMIFTLYRDEVYNPDTYDQGVMELLCEKNRHGATFFYKLAWEAKYMRIQEQLPQESDYGS